LIFSCFFTKYRFFTFYDFGHLWYLCVFFWFWTIRDGQRRMIFDPPNPKGCFRQKRGFRYPRFGKKCLWSSTVLKIPIYTSVNYGSYLRNPKTDANARGAGRRFTVFPGKSKMSKSVIIVTSLSISPPYNRCKHRFLMILTSPGTILDDFDPPERFWTLSWYISNTNTSTDCYYSTVPVNVYVIEKRTVTIRRVLTPVNQQLFT
jgi:hypothetical protein